VYFFFFFQAEDGIRDKLVTGVQTCALPISRCPSAGRGNARAPRRGAGERATRGAGERDRCGVRTALANGRPPALERIQLRRKLNALQSFCVVAFSDGKPVPAFPEML